MRPLRFHFLVLKLEKKSCYKIADLIQTGELCCSKFLELQHETGGRN